MNTTARALALIGSMALVVMASTSDPPEKLAISADFNSAGMLATLDPPKGTTELEYQISSIPNTSGVVAKQLFNNTLDLDSQDIVKLGDVMTKQTLSYTLSGVVSNLKSLNETAALGSPDTEVELGDAMTRQLLSYIPNDAIPNLSSTTSLLSRNTDWGDSLVPIAVDFALYVETCFFGIQLS